MDVVGFLELFNHFLTLHLGLVRLQIFFVELDEDCVIVFDLDAKWLGEVQNLIMGH